MALARFDVTWPIMRIVLPEAMEIEEIDQFCARIGSHYADRQGWIQVIDMNAVQPLKVPATVRQHFASTSDALDLKYAGALHAQALCIESALVRGVFTAYQWLKRQQSFETAVFRSTDAAEPWVLQRAQKVQLRTAV